MNHSNTTFTPSEVAQILGVKPSIIYAMLSRGELGAPYRGRRRIITANQLQQCLARRSRVGVEKTYAHGPAFQLSLITRIARSILTGHQPIKATVTDAVAACKSLLRHFIGLEIGTALLLLFSS